MGWICSNCGLPWKQQNKTRCSHCLTGTEAERWPPLDGFMVLDAHPEKPEEQDLSERDEWFKRKRERVG